MTKPGTFMYHPHFDEMTQIALGMVGMIVVHPKKPPNRRVRDYSLMTHEWMIPIGARRPDPMAGSWLGESPDCPESAAHHRYLAVSARQ